MRVVVFTPRNPFPVRSGAQYAILEVLIALRALGAKVHIAGAERFSDTPWKPEARSWLIDNGLCHSLSVYQDARSLPGRIGRRLSQRLAPILAIDPARRAGLERTTLAMRHWFSRISQRESADVTLINYAWFAGLVASRSHRSKPRTVVDTHDLITLNSAMCAKLEPFIRTGLVFQPDSVSEEALDLQFYDCPEIRAEPLEFQCVGRFDAALAIAEDEAAAIRAQVQTTHVFLAPRPVTPPPVRQPQGRFALFPMGAHSFNLQGYAWFVRKVLPRIVSVCPDFELAVSGITYYQVTLEYHPNVRILGFVSDAPTLWSLGRMLINPVFGGTGQPIKTLEAMAAGLPPVILRRFAHAAPIRQGDTGFIATDEREFADYCIRLWRDSRLCWDMGARAIEAVREHCSRQKFTEQLQAALYDQ